MQVYRSDSMASCGCQFQTAHLNFPCLLPWTHCQAMAETLGAHWDNDVSPLEFPPSGEKRPPRGDRQAVGHHGGAYAAGLIAGAAAEPAEGAGRTHFSTAHNWS